MRLRVVLIGFAAWAGGSLLLRFLGQRLLHPGDWKGTLLLFAVSFPCMAWLVRRVCRSSGTKPEQWLAVAFSILLPTMLLDPFSSAFFPAVFPNMPPEAAGLFGGWMLWCCAGGLAGSVIRPARP